ncbi:protease TldD [Phycisphaerae bacterium RAS1]|nr:protease TldD [Phycisphaerae bacterium RAS1]
MCRDQHLTRRDFLHASAGLAGMYVIGCAPGGGEVRRAPSAASQPAAADADIGPGDWRGLADAAMQRVRRGGAAYGDIRIIKTTTQSVFGQDRRIANVSDGLDRGFGVRVLVNGAWGFAASSVISAAEVRRIADLALEIARGSAMQINDPVQLAPEPVYEDTVVTPRRIDPFSVPLEDRTALLLAVMEKLQSHSGVARSSASLWAQRDIKFFASTEGSRIRYDLLAVQGGFSATAIHEGRFATRRFSTPHLRTGWEMIDEAAFLNEAPRVAEQAVEKVQAPQVEPGRYDLVLDPQHLSLTIHESCGHPTELDRALGYEANYAGTSFLTTDKLNNFQYGSREVSIVADNREPGCLASTGYDDDGVEGQRWPIIQQGQFVGYSTSRELAGKVREQRSRGSCRADSWASVPIIRIANVGLEPGTGRLDDMIADVKRGIYIEGHDSFSIDQRRYNFQFGGDAFWLIENGKRKGMLRDVIYTGITSEFWNSCDAVADLTHRKRFGFINCGKGQPGQSGWMTHAASHARFRGVNVIAGKTAT